MKTNNLNKLTLSLIVAAIAIVGCDSKNKQEKQQLETTTTESSHKKQQDKQKPTKEIHDHTDYYASKKTNDLQ